MFGPIMRFGVGDLIIEMAPLRREDMPLFITDGGMQSHEVTRYLGRQLAPTEQCEYDWFDQVRGKEDTYLWGIYVVDGEERTLIGNTSLNGITREVMSYASTGCLIFNRQYWGKGIASHCHRVRTWYGCTQLNLVQLRSAAYDLNQGSQKALMSVGYVPLFTERNFGFVEGQFLSATSFGLINPLETHWNLWWHGDLVPEEFAAARTKSQQALRWVEDNVSF